MKQEIFLFTTRVISAELMNTAMKRFVVIPVTSAVTVLYRANEPSLLRTTLSRELTMTMTKAVATPKPTVNIY